MLAPRPFLSISPLEDDNFAVEGVRKATAAAQEVYRLLKAPGALQVYLPAGGHGFPPESRERASARGGVPPAASVTAGAPAAERHVADHDPAVAAAASPDRYLDRHRNDLHVVCGSDERDGGEAERRAGLAALPAAISPLCQHGCPAGE